MIKFGILCLIFTAKLKFINSQSSFRKCCPANSVLDARFKTCVPHQAQQHENLQTLEYKTLQDTGLLITKKIEPEYDENFDLPCNMTNQFLFNNTQFSFHGDVLILPPKFFFLDKLTFKDRDSYCLDSLRLEDGSLVPGAKLCECQDHPCLSMCPGFNETYDGLHPSVKFIKPQRHCEKVEELQKGSYEVSNYGELTVCDRTYDNHEYCIDKQGEREKVLVCVYDYSSCTTPISTTKLILLFLSAFSLSVITLICIVCRDFLTREAGYVQLLMYLNLMMVSLLLFISQLKNYVEDRPGCFIIAFLIQFCSLAAFSFMTTSSYSFWMKLRHIQFPESDMSLWSLVFSFGLPSIIVVTTIVVQFSVDDSQTKWPTSFLDSVDDTWIYFHPGIGRDKCYLANHVPRIFYFELPIFLLLCVNMISFSSIFYNIFWGTWKSSSLTSSNFVTKDRLLLLLKLFFLMGLNWFVERDNEKEMEPYKESCGETKHQGRNQALAFIMHRIVGHKRKNKDDNICESKPIKMFEI